MAGDASLARLFRDYGDTREIEKIPRDAEWVAIRRDATDYPCIVAAHDLAALRYHINRAENTDRDDPETVTRP